MIIGTVCAFAIRGMAFDGAYAIRPYLGRWKRAAFGCCYVGVYPNTPHRYPIRGKRKAFDDQMCKMIFGPKGRLWGVCNTPLLGKMNTCRVWMFPCRGVLHTPYIYRIRGKRKAFDDQMCKMIFGPKGRLWGVCNTPLRWRIETCRVCGMSPSDTSKTKQPDMLTHAGLHSHSDGRAVHSQK